MLSFDLKSAESKRIELVHKSVKVRVAETILILKNIYGRGEDKKRSSAH